MIKIIETPQYSSFKYTYEIRDDVLTLTMNEETEILDLTDLPEGQAESIELEVLPINPVVTIEKTGEIIEVTLIRFYDSDEKELFENGED
jgi:hypothetical protein